jgi:hypothetical protein
LHATFRLSQRRLPTQPPPTPIPHARMQAKVACMAQHMVVMATARRHAELKRDEALMTLHFLMRAAAGGPLPLEAAGRAAAAAALIEQVRA